jgi:hypothetical protein
LVSVVGKEMLNGPIFILTRQNKSFGGVHAESGLAQSTSSTHPRPICLSSVLE